MRIIRLAAVAALGAIAINTLLKARGRGDSPHAQERPDASAPATGNADSTGRSAQASPPLDTAGRATATDAADSPNAGERLKARQPAGTLADGPAAGLGLTSPASSETEYAQATGLADFARGA
jgi:hypothetical protein